MIGALFKKTHHIHYKRPHLVLESDNKSYDIQVVNEPSVPQGMWRKCKKCRQLIYGEDVKNNNYICPKCEGYFRVHAYRRLEMILDGGSFDEWDEKVEFTNPLDFPGYENKVEIARERTKLNEAIVTGKGSIHDFPVAIGVCDARFLMSSMGYVVGEKITRMVERAISEKLPVIIFACSGGARMQEGIVSLMQMAKTSAALSKLHEVKQLFISVLTDPTTGGVTASFAMLGDIILAEPDALIGFAGPRVIAQTIGQKLPEGFQKSEFLLNHGFVDMIVKREEQRETLAGILKLHAAQEREMNYKPVNDHFFSMEEAHYKVNSEWIDNESFYPQIGKTEECAWDHVKLSRRLDRPTSLKYIQSLFDDFIEFHGDRYFGDDNAIVGGIASFEGIPVTVIGQEKGRNTKENIKCKFGMPSPEGYRKALRLMKQAEVFGRPIICFIDTPGAYCGLEAEERGQGEAIARNLFEMFNLKVPVLSIVIGEGGSGGALAMAVANEVWMLENAVYSILSPEGFASILWKDSKRAAEAADVMKITADDLFKRRLIERIIPEREPVTEKNISEVIAVLKVEIIRYFIRIQNMSHKDFKEQRYERFRKM